MLKKWGMAILWFCYSSLSMAFGLEELQNQLQAPQTIKGDFTQQRYLKSLAKPIVSRGEFVLVPNSGLLWQLKKPFVDTMRVRKTGIEQLNPQGKWVASQQSASVQKNQVKLFLDLLAGQTSGLQSQFTIALTGNSGQWQIQLLPKSVLMKQIFTKIDISGGSVVKTISLYEQQGDHTDILFSNIKINAGLNGFEQAAILP